MQYTKLTEDAKSPTRGSEFAAGFDLCTIENADILPGKSAVLKTGIAFAIDKGFGGFIEPRSKLGAKKQVQVLAGLIDSDYRGEVMIALLNSGDSTLELRKGDKIAQIVFAPIFSGHLELVGDLSDTVRGKNGINCLDMRLT